MSENTKVVDAMKAVDHYASMLKGGGNPLGSGKKGDDQGAKRKKMGTEIGTYQQWAEKEKASLEVIPTGISELDEATGIGGLPKGKMVELFGTESGGKSYIAYHAIASCQKMGGVAALLDVENAFTPEWVRTIGIDTDSLLYKNEPMSMEAYLQLAYDLCSGGYVDLIVIDSTAALVPQTMLDGVVGDQDVAIQARVLSPAVSKLQLAAPFRGKGGKQTCIVWINQIREKPGTMFGCFHYNSRVVLEDGSTMKIGKIVNNKIDVKVLSYNSKTGKIEPKKIIDWHDNGNLKDDECFIQIVAEKHGGNGRANVSCTPNHILFKNIGFDGDEQRYIAQEIQARDLCVGDSILISQPKYLDETQYQVVYGSILGDGSIRKLKDGCSHLRIGHGLKQKEYARWKQEILSNVVSYIGDESNKYSFDTIPMYELNRLNYRTKVGKNKYCVIPKEISEKIDLLGLTIWYLDDGTFGGSYKKFGKGKCSISCTKFSNSDVMISSFERFGLKVKHSERGFFFDAKNTEKFHSMICKFVPPCMDYKIHPKFRGKYEFIIDDYSDNESFCYMVVPSKIIDIYEKPETKTKKKFDLTIEDNSTYLIDGVIVHNSPETTPGGRALKFYCHMRIDVRRGKIERLKKGEIEEPIYQMSTGTMVKNKLAIPGKKFTFKISFESNLGNPLVLLGQYAYEKKIFYKSKGEFKYRLEDEKADPVPTGVSDSIELGRWIHSQGLIEEIVTRVTNIDLSENKTPPDFLEKIDASVQPPLKIVDAEESVVESSEEKEEESK